MLMFSETEADDTDVAAVEALSSQPVDVESHVAAREEEGEAGKEVAEEALHVIAGPISCFAHMIVLIVSFISPTCLSRISLSFFLASVVLLSAQYPEFLQEDIVPFFLLSKRGRMTLLVLTSDSVLIPGGKRPCRSLASRIFRFRSYMSIIGVPMSRPWISFECTTQTA